MENRRSSVYRRFETICTLNPAFIAYFRKMVLQKKGEDVVKGRRIR